MIPDKENERFIVEFEDFNKYVYQKRVSSKTLKWLRVLNHNVTQMFISDACLDACSVWPMFWTVECQEICAIHGLGDEYMWLEFRN